MRNTRIPAVVECPACGRMVSTFRYKFARHTDAALAECELSMKLVTEEALELTAWVRRAEDVAALAVRVRDEDPTLVWQHLERLDAGELRRLLMTALALAPEVEDVPFNELYGWVRDLAVAS